MLQQYEQNPIVQPKTPKIECPTQANASEQISTPSAPELSSGTAACSSTELKPDHLPPVLTPELSARHRKIVDAAVAACVKSDPEIKRLIRSFSTGRYADSELRLALAALDSAEKGATPRSRVCAWLLGLPLLRPIDQPKAAEVLRAALLKAHAGPKSHDGRQFMRAALMVSPIAILFGVASALGIDALGPWGAALVTALTIPLTSALLTPLALLYLRRKEVSAAKDLRFLAAHALSRLQAVEAIDAVAAASTERDTELREVALASLRTLLPLLTPDHYGRLGPDAVPALCRLLQVHARGPILDETSGELNKELLLAIEKIGDARAIAAVTAARERPGLTETADRVLAVLEERRLRETNRLTLLRGSDPLAVPDNELLRASTGLQETSPEQLLRPVNGEN